MNDNLPAKKTVSSEAYAWKMNGRNSLLEGDDFYISYNAKTSNLFGGFGAGDGSGEETAIFKDGRYYILNGDWRKEYEAVFDQGFEACYKVYLENKADFQSSWSSDRMDEDRGLLEGGE